MKLLHKFNLTKSLKQIFGIFKLCKLSESNNKQKYIDRWHLSAEGFLLLPSALRPHLSISILTILFLGVAAEAFWLTDEVSAASIELTVPANYTIELNPGTGTTFGESSNQPISIKTSGSFGYTLNIKGSSDTNLKNGSNVIKTITKSDGYTDKTAYQTSNETNTWAYKPGKLNSVANTKYLPFPSAEALLDKTSSNNDTANNYDLTIATKVDNTLPAGKYSNNFVISATANTVSYSITYNLNSGTWSGTSPQTGTTTNNIVKLDSNKPTRENYEFLDWCSKETTNETCTGERYQPGNEYILSNGDNTFSLWAMWRRNIPTSMQDFDDYCNFMAVNQTMNLKDTRDNNTYSVAKLSDNRCWMTQGLRIVNKTIDSADSDMTSGSFTIPVSNKSKFVSSNNNNDAAYYNNNQDDGAYYTWHTATAGTGTSGMSSGDATSSICPKGWKLPKGGAAGSAISDFVTLAKAYGGTGNNGTDATTRDKLIASPAPHFTYAGYIYYDNGTQYYHGSQGFYWSRTAYSAAIAYDLCFKSDGTLSPAYDTGGTKRYGLPVRCVVAQ